ncbi:aldo/keto reductase [Planktotalea sp.]|uniref:aldo/keto reductase n=1 Tax=Planktotalea sp. TaxID=2029877 RepID=UPI0025D2FB50|nr:aldo/keto reductase [Planktotalea sp.]
MKTRKLGQDGPIVSAVGYGAMSFTDFYGPANDANAPKVLGACLDLGITHLDTSNAYGMGRSETVIGDWLRARGGVSPFTIATKVGITRDPEHRFNNSPEHLSQSLDESLKRLGVEAIDLYYVHRRDTRHEIEEVTETMAGFVKAGKIKAIGYSEIAPSSLRRAHAVHPIAAVQSEYSLSTRAPELGVKQTCAAIGASLVAFSPVGRALLTDRPHSRETAQTLPFLTNNPRFMEPNISANLAYSAKFCALAADMGVAAATLAIAWVLHQGEEVVAIPGTRHIAHLDEVAKGGALDLSAEDIARIEAVLPVGWAHGDRYSAAQWVGPERYC